MNDERPTILVVEDDSGIRSFLADNLAADGYMPLLADSARDALRAIEQKYPDLVLLDLGLPDATGLDLLARIRGSDGVVSRVNPELPVVILSGRAEEMDRLRGFERGCDDYLSKPFSYPELRARLAALLRRSGGQSGGGRVRVGELEVNPASREVLLGGAHISLSQKEFALLRTLVSDPTRVFSKEELLRSVWGFRTVGSTRTLDSHACRLRRKLSSRGARFVVNVWGIGYRLVDGPRSDAEFERSYA